MIEADRPIACAQAGATYGNWARSGYGLTPTQSQLASMHRRRGVQPGKYFIERSVNPAILLLRRNVVRAHGMVGPSLAG